MSKLEESLNTLALVIPNHTARMDAMLAKHLKQVRYLTEGFKQLFDDLEARVTVLEKGFE